MYEIFAKLLNMSLTAGIMAVVVMLCRIALKRLPKKYVCLLWALVAIRLLCPVSISSPVSAYNAISSKANASGQMEYFQYNGKSEKPTLVFDVPALVNDDTSPDSATFGTKTSAVYIPTVVIVWAVGAAAMLLYAVISYLRLRRETSAAIRCEGGYYICDDIDTPFILGIFTPRIYLPSGMDNWTKVNVLAHERAHLSRRDYWWKPLAYVLLAMHWFNPVLWFAYILFCRDIEAACDEKVVSRMDKVGVAGYAEALLVCAARKKTVSVCPVAFGETDAKGRVKNVLSYRKPRVWAVIAAVILCAVVGVGFMTNPKVEATEHASSVSVNAEAEVVATNTPVPDDSVSKHPLNPYQAAQTVPFAPADITNIIRAEIHEEYGNFVVDDAETLQWLETQLSNAEEITPTGCPFGTVIYLYREDGTVGTIEPAEDSCSVFRSDGKYYQLNDNEVEILKTMGVKQSYDKVEMAQDGDNKIYTIRHYWWYQEAGTPTIAVYDGNNRLIHVEDPDNLICTDYDYNDAGYCVGCRDYFPDSGTEGPDRIFTYEYDFDGVGLLRTERWDAEDNSRRTFEFVGSEEQDFTCQVAIAYLETLPFELQQSITNIYSPFIARVSMPDMDNLVVAEGYELSRQALTHLAKIVVFETNSAEILAPIAIYIDDNYEVVGMVGR